MAREDRNTFTAHPNDKPSSGRSVAAGRPASRLAETGRSGYGTESIRPHLRAQLEQHTLLRLGFGWQDFSGKPQADE